MIWYNFLDYYNFGMCEDRLEKFLKSYEIAKKKLLLKYSNMIFRSV